MSGAKMPEQRCETHVSEEDLTDYARDSLAETHRAEITAHLQNCPTCTRQVDQIRTFINCIQHAVHFLDSYPLDCTHDTREGPIRVRSYRLNEAWVSEVAGEIIATGLPDCGQANQRAIDRFSALFPDHTCSATCRIQRSDATGAAGASPSTIP